MEMIVKRQNCESCVHYEICGIKTDIDLFKNDVQKMLAEKGKTYASIIKPFGIKVTCSHFTTLESLKEKSNT